MENCTYAVEDTLKVSMEPTWLQA